VNAIDLDLKPLCWDDLSEGTCYESPSRTVTEADVVAFAGLTGDYNRLHVDAEYARTTQFGQRVAHGLLVASMSVGLVTRAIQSQRLELAMLGLLENRLRFPAPTFIGDTIRVEIIVTRLSPTKRHDRGIAVFNRRTLNQRKELVVDSESTLLLKRSRSAQA
jgi:acyl dehydratase